MADHHEIIIIHRHGDHDDGHHGGAWKIALADFMTAMMALFLVMWLMSSTSKETKAAIADYFNPIRLSETSPEKKGLRDPTGEASQSGEEGKPEARSGESKGKSEEKVKEAAASGGAAGKTRESALFQDPYAVLAKLAAEADQQSETAMADAMPGESGRPGLAGGEAARDPFDPLYWQVPALPQARTEVPGPVNTVAKPPRDTRIDAKATVREARAGSDLLPKEIADLIKPPETKAAKASETKPEAKPTEAKPTETKPVEAKLQDKMPEGKAAEVKAPDAKSAEADAAAAELKAEIAKAVQPLGTASPAPKIEVRRTGEGVLISVTDELNFSMFGVGSAEPQAKVVKALERIAKIVSSRPGRLVLRGHTDGRPFKSDTYDNWRLSSARAQMAAYMLIRGGVQESRIERVEGYADRQPRNAADPLAAENRRIEILLRERSE